MAASTSTGPYCTSLSCRSEADVVIRLEDGRERPVCEGCAEDGEVIRDA